MIHKKLFLIIIVLFCIHHFPAQTLEIVKTKKWELELDLLFAPAYVFNHPSLWNGFCFEKADIEIRSEYDNRIRFVIHLDFTGLYAGFDSLAAELLEDLYLQYNFFKQLHIRAGLFKVPLGEEISLGITERPYLEHSLGSKKLAPGRRQGLMISGRDLFSILGYRIGIFNTSETDKPENETPYLSTAGKLFLEFDDFPGIYLKTGYSGYYGFDEIFAQSAFLHFSWQINNIHKISLFGEYLEERFYHYHWNHSIYLSLSYRPGDFEIYCTGELYDENSGIMDKDDCFSLCSGMSMYWLKDRLKACLGHNYRNEYHAMEEENRFTLMILWEH